MLDSNLKIGAFKTPHGPIFIHAAEDPKESSRPSIVVLHGALRHSENTKVWAPVLSDLADLIFVDMPGHGYTPAEGEASIQNFAGRVRFLVERLLSGRKTVVIGESVGGLIALCLADGQTAGVTGVLISDPPLSTAKLWPVFNNFLRPTSGPHSEFMKSFFLNTFGYFLTEGGGGIARDRHYYGLVQRSRVKTLILTGDLPLFPVRPMPNNVPCLLDDVDKMFIRAMGNPNVSLATLPGVGHLCLDPAFEHARHAVVEFCTERFSENAQQNCAAEVA